MAPTKPVATKQASPQQQDAAGILGVIAGALSRGASGRLGDATAQAVIAALTAAGYTIK